VHALHVLEHRRQRGQDRIGFLNGKVPHLSNSSCL
jgi:hypothetical protein